MNLFCTFITTQVLAFILCTDAEYLALFLKWSPVGQKCSVTHFTLKVRDFISELHKNLRCHFWVLLLNFLQSNLKSGHETYWITAADPRWSLVLFCLSFVMRLLFQFWHMIQLTCLGTCTSPRIRVGHSPPQSILTTWLIIVPQNDSVCFNKLRY